MTKEVTLILVLSLISITIQTPYSHHSDYSSHNERPDLRSRSLYSSSRYESDRHGSDRHGSDRHGSDRHGSSGYHDEMERAESRHSRHRSDHREPISHHPFDHKSHSRDDHSDQLSIHHPNYEFNLRSHDSHRDSLDDPFRNKRQAFLPYFPYYSYLPPVYQVHNIYLTPPGYTCIPTRSGYPERPTKAPEPVTPDSDLGTRLGTAENTTETTKQPSKCVWSIVACCSPGSRDIRYACFELLGCPGAFWDVNPCDERVVTAAANSALKYYMNNQAPTTEPTFQNL